MKIAWYLLDVGFTAAIMMVCKIKLKTKITVDFVLATLGLALKAKGLKRELAHT